MTIAQVSTLISPERLSSKDLRATFDIVSGGIAGLATGLLNHSDTGTALLVGSVSAMLSWQALNNLKRQEGPN